MRLITVISRSLCVHLLIYHRGMAADINITRSDGPSQRRGFSLLNVPFLIILCIRDVYGCPGSADEYSNFIAYDAIQKFQINILLPSTE
jgi:hypothetical protein